MIRYFNCTTGLCLALLLAGCASTGWQQPRVALPAKWDAAPASQGLVPDDAAFWQLFGDPQLDTLLAAALAQNNDLAAAAIRLRKAGFAVEQSGQARWPDVTLGANSSAGWSLRPTQYTGNSYSASLGVAWEIDLWGRLADAEAAARWREKASQAELAGLRQSIRSDVAGAYWTIARDSEALQLAQDELARSRQLQKIVDRRYAAGVVSGLDVTQARASVLQQEKTVNAARLAQAKSRWALGVLLNQNPESTGSMQARLPQVFPDIPAGLPAELLDRRPDLAAATATLRAAFADQAASQKSWYPKLTLTGSLGGNSPQLANLLANPVATLGSGLVLPFIQWQEMQSAIKISEADYELAVITYRQKLLTALQEVENALATRSQLQEDLPRLAQLAADNRLAETQTLLRYDAGATAFDTVLTARSKRQSAEYDLLQQRYQLALASTTVYKTLGGVPQAAP